MGTKERRAREKVRRRDEIIDAAEQMFFSKGANNTTMDDIADAAELAKGTLYLYFSNKEDIHYAVAERGIAILNKMVSDNKFESKNPIEKLIDLGKIFIEFAQKNPERFKILIHIESIDLQKVSISREEIRNKIYTDSPVRFVYEFVQEGMNQNFIRNDIPAEIIANTLWSQMFGVVEFAFARSGVYELSGFSTEQLFENHLEIVLNGIKHG